MGWMSAHRMLWLALVALAARSATVTAQLPAPAAPRDTTTREFRGSYQVGFEQSWFAPCNAPLDDKLWWVTLTDRALAQRDSMLATISRPPTTGLAVRWRGTISNRMPSGHMGGGSRYLLVTSILEIRPTPAEGACPPERAS